MARTQRDEVVAALEQLGGPSHLDEIARTLAEMYPDDPPPEPSIRRVLEQGSRDSKAFEGPDLFYSADGVGRGVWGLSSWLPAPSTTEVHERAVALLADRLRLVITHDADLPLQASDGTRYQVRARTTGAGVRGRRIAVTDPDAPLLIVLFDRFARDVVRAFRLGGPAVRTLTRFPPSGPYIPSASVLDAGPIAQDVTDALRGRSAALSDGDIPGDLDAVVLRSNEGAPGRDVTGVSYEYSSAYRSIVVEGQPFVYYRSADKQGGPRYFGTGVIGAIADSSATPGWLECEILDYRAFEVPISFKRPDGTYREPNGSRKGYYQPGVRRIPLTVLESILSSADLTDDETGLVASGAAGSNKYPPSQLARLVDAYAMDVAELEVRRRFPDCTVQRMAQNNPSYDIRVLRGKAIVWYVEVKGTAGVHGSFFLSEGQRAFSHRKASRYSLLVIRDIDLDRRTHAVRWFDGPVERERFSLSVMKWQGIAPS